MHLGPSLHRLLVLDQDFYIIHEGSVGEALLCCLGEVHLHC